LSRIYILDMEDLENVGCIGLIRAYELYDPTKTSIAFSTYAYYRICTALTRYMYDFNPTISFPRRAREVYVKILRNNLLEQPYEFISEKLNIKMSDVIVAMDYYNTKNVTYT